MSKVKAKKETINEKTSSVKPKLTEQASEAKKPLDTPTKKTVAKTKKIVKPQNQDVIINTTTVNEISELKSPNKKTITKSTHKIKESVDRDTETFEISDLDKFLFHEGKHHHVHKFMGAHKSHEQGKDGIRFTTWAPNAGRICVIGDFNGWQLHDEFNMSLISSGGMWSLFIPHVKNGMKYKFAIFNKHSGHVVYKSDPYGISSELRPQNASVVNLETSYTWNDAKWLSNRAKHDKFNTPMNVYEVHLASWKTKDGFFMTYDELSEVLPQYVHDMGYTHVELMPLHEHPLDKSWGYQAVGYFSPTSRHGDLRGLKKLVDKFHQLNIGVFLDWVAGHFCKDQHGLINFDGSPTYEYQDNRKANNEGWGAHNFDLGRNEVKSFLISNAIYWINEFHIDGLRVDAVSNIIYLNYDRNDGEWSPNIHGGNENLEGTGFLREFNWTIHNYFPGVITVAEESSSWPNITGSVHENGLGFDFKWNMGWMNDTLRYVELDPVYRKYHHNLINFSMIYHYSEKFILSLSHDEVVHGKKSLVNKMWGDLWNKYAGYRTYLGYMIGHPGKKFNFMGNEFAQFIEWRDFEQLQWNVIEEFPIHKQIQNYTKALNKLYLDNPCLWELDYDTAGFRWIDADNGTQSILSFVRYSKDKKESLIFVCNFTPMTYFDYKLGVTSAGSYVEIFNSDAEEFGGSNQLMKDKLFSTPGECHGCEQYVQIKIPPMATLILKQSS